MDESSLVKKCIGGSQKAQRKLFEMFAPKMLGVCLRYAKNKQQAEDVLQDAFIKVFTKLELFKGGSLEGWIRRIVVNTSLDDLRKYKIDDKNYILEKIHAEDLLLLINNLPDGYRTVFNMFAIEGYAHKEIADELGISENTSKSQYARAKIHLQQKMKDLGIER